ncbi:unnamed protein product [Microthlaspi erraticum]|uniref:RNase H type-1 domain-containing protein n=1 Tax=Microthlaspi erraticum TaxID=1685480 RepID=A0A6D2I7H6_9BRAS|nr:unnamed protein product [Microthlaspi erraticum]
MLIYGYINDPRDVLEPAITEARAWASPQTVHETVRILPANNTGTPISGEWCQVDGACKETECHAGLGWYNFDPSLGSILVGSCNLRRGLSPLQTELEALVWAFEILLKEVEKCKRKFHVFSLTHIPRTKNTNADKLARSARDQPYDVYYVNSIPPATLPIPR